MSQFITVFKKYMIYILLLIGFAACFVALWIMNSSKLYTFSDIKIPIPQQPEINSGSITSPVVYELIYKSNSGATWKFAPSRDIISDFEARRLNTLLIAGTMYTLKNLINIDINNDMILTLHASCKTPRSFVGSTCAQNTWPTNTTLFILGYNFTGVQEEETTTTFFIPQKQAIKK
jgi:hypothetical protein